MPFGNNIKILRKFLLISEHFYSDSFVNSPARLRKVKTFPKTDWRFVFIADRSFYHALWDSMSFTVEVLCDWLGILPGTERNSDYEVGFLIVTFYDVDCVQEIIGEFKLKRKIERAVERYPSSFGDCIE